MIDRHTLRVIDPAALQQLRKPSQMQDAMRRAVADHDARQKREKQIAQTLVDMVAEDRARQVRARRMAESYRDNTIGRVA